MKSARYGTRLMVLFLPVLAVFVVAAAAPAQTGVLQGQVVDTTGAALPGVRVHIEGTARNRLTDENGRYLFRDLPAGTHPLVASVVGYQTETRSVTVNAGAITVADLVLRISPVELEGITVEAQRGIVRTLENKRQSPVVLDVLDREQLERLPFQDMVEALDQLPAVNIQGISAGRGFQNSYIVIRGIRPNLNQVSVAGMPLTSTTGDRAVALDVLPGGMASQLEVVKTVTPDMSANTIGGTANIVPISAFDRQGSWFTGSVQAATQDETGVLTSDELPLDINLAGAARLSSSFGVAASGSYKREAFARTFSQPDGWEPIPQPGFPEDLWVPEGTRLEQSQTALDRYSGTVNLDWRPNPATSFGLLTSYTHTRDEQISTQTEWNYADGKNNIDFELLDDGRIFSPEGENEKEMDIDDQTEEIFFALADARFRFEPATLDVSGGFTRTDLDVMVREWSFDSVNFPSYIEARSRVPWAMPVDAAAFANPSSYTFAEVDMEPDRRRTDAAHLRADLQFDVDLLGEGGYVKFGGSFRTADTEADADENQMEFSGNGFDDISLAGLGLAFDAGSVFGYPVGPAIDPYRGPRFVEENPSFLFHNQNAAVSSEIESDYAVEEDVLAGYAMLTGEWGPWQLIGGVRLEQTNTLSEFKIFNENDESISEESEENDYLDVLPSLNVRYRVSDQVQLRGAATKTIARPNLSQLAGARTIDFDNSDIVSTGVISEASLSQGNPALEPFESINLDATLEFYPRRGSFYMLGAFYKAIDNAIFTQNTERRDVTLGGTHYQEIDFEQPQNAKSGSLVGLEAQVQETFTFLPGWLRGLGVSGNVALLDSEFEIPGREDEKLPLFQQPDVILGFTPFLSLGDVTASVSYQWTDEYAVGFGSDGTEDEYFDAREQLDAQISYEWRNRYTLVLGAENLTRSAVREYQGMEARTSGLEEIPATIWLGLRARFSGFEGPR